MNSVPIPGRPRQTFSAHRDARIEVPAQRKLAPMPRVPARGGGRKPAPRAGLSLAAFAVRLPPQYPCLRCCVLCVCLACLSCHFGTTSDADVRHPAESRLWQWCCCRRLRLRALRSRLPSHLYAQRGREQRQPDDWNESLALLLLVLRLLPTAGVTGRRHSGLLLSPPRLGRKGAPRHCTDLGPS